MGKFLKKASGALFGKPAASDASSLSQNTNNGMLTGAFGGDDGIGLTSSAGGLMKSLLSGDTTALENFSNSGGMKFMRDQGMKAIESNKAASGLLNSGSYGTALADYNAGVSSQYMDKYLGHVNDMGKLGLGAGGILADSGDTSRSKSKERGAKKGIAGTIIKAVAASDRRLKENIEHVGYLDDGLGVYEYDYKKGFGLPEARQTGVMADEVLQLRPDAYVPNFIGEYAGVNYAKL